MYVVESFTTAKQQPNFTEINDDFSTYYKALIGEWDRIKQV